MNSVRDQATAAQQSLPTSGGEVGSDKNNPNFVPLTRARRRENLDNLEAIDINNIEEPQGFEESAKKARLSGFKLSENEFNIFFDLIGHDQNVAKNYLYIRNKILEQWFANVQVELKKQKAFDALDENELSTISPALSNKLFDRCFNYLERAGYINFGLLDSSQSQANFKLADRSKRAPLMTSHLYKPPLKMGAKRTGRVIVIGAGLSGLMAARQLQKFGMEVIVLEARNRVGGRVHTYKKGNFIADLGPSSLNGVVGNPIVVLGKQLELSIVELRQKIPIYENKVDKNNQAVCHLVEPLLERAVEREYNKIMEGTRVMKNNYRIETYQGKPFPLGLAVDWVMKLQEKNIKDEQNKHLQSIEELYQKLIDCANVKLSKTRIIKKLNGELSSIKDSTNDLNCNNGFSGSIQQLNHRDKGAIDTFNRRSLARDLDLALKEYKILTEQEEEFRKKIEELLKSPPSDTYLSLSDRRLLDWHFAELEYALGCPISELGICYEDDEEIFDGSHWMLVHGFNSIVEAMKADLDIQLGTAVKKITIQRNGCKVLTYQPDHPQNNYAEITADAILCTLPLGILQDSIIISQQAAAGADNASNNATTTSNQYHDNYHHQHQIHNINSRLNTQSRPMQKGYQPLIFSPPLPRWKMQSLNKLGCGNLNKIVMSFEKAFWLNSLHLFGVVNHKAIARGEYFLFWHHGRTPTLTGLISGEAADKIESFSDVEILERCLNVLRSIYGVTNVPAPKDYIVTKWRKDPWAKGAWSYLQTGASGDDYDVCAEPVVLDPANESRFKETMLSQQLSPTTPPPNESVKNPLMKRIKTTDEIPRLFFAGEHTTRYFFASAHGAVLTGLREAARIANIYLGCPYDDEDEPGIYAS